MGCLLYDLYINASETLNGIVRIIQQEYIFKFEANLKKVYAKQLGLQAFLFAPFIPPPQEPCRKTRCLSPVLIRLRLYGH